MIVRVLEDEDWFDGSVARRSVAIHLVIVDVD